MNVFVAILIVSAILAIVRLSKTLGFEKKTAYTLCGLPILIVLSVIQAVIEKNANISAAFWLLSAIFVVLFVNTIITNKELNKKKINTENVANEEAERGKEAVEAEFEEAETETPPAPPTL